MRFAFSLMAYPAPFVFAKYAIEQEKNATLIYEQTTRYPIFTRGRFMVTGKDRVEVAGVNIPVSIGNVKVCPNDIMLCDDSGVLVVPLKQAEVILQVAAEINEKEQRILEMLDKGRTLGEARQKMGYHSLQTKR
jgi:regulator of RNase E activity RraA